MRRDVFDEIGGFDAIGLAIAFNDVDLCLRVRATGRRVLFSPRICAIHHESKSRGKNKFRSKVAWDLEELGLLHQRWGASLFEDPGYNPNWTTTGEPFLGYRFAGFRETVRHIDRSARVQPWRITIGEDEPVWW